MRYSIIYLFVAALSIFSIHSFAQPPVPCTNGTQNTCKCNTSPMLCTIDELDGYVYSMTTYLHPTDGPYNPAGGGSFMCPGGVGTTSHNPTWFRFPAWCTDMELEVCYNNCIQNPGQCNSLGMQVAVYSECFGCPPPDCFGPSWAQNSQNPPPYTYAVGCDVNGCGPASGCAVIEMVELEIGKVYYLLVDGCCGSACDIEISVLSVCGPPVIADFEVIDGPTIVCAGGDSIEYFHPIPDGANTLHWYIDGVELQVGSGPSSQFFKALWTFQGTYELCFDASQDPCIDVDEDPEPTCITVEVVDDISVNITGPTNLCPGQSGILNAGSGYTSYLWSTGATTQTITINNPGTYSVTVVENGGCSGSDSHTVNVSPPLSPTASSNSPVCPGASINLFATGGNSYQWSGPAGFNSNLQNPTIPNAQSANAGTYMVIVNDGSGCTGTASTVVVVNSAPQATASSNSPVCVGATINLNASGGTSYSWSGPSGFSSTQQNPSINNTQTIHAGTYTVIVTSGQGCTAAASTSVIVNILPTINASSNSPLCTGATLNLFSSGGGTYQWSGPNNFSSNEAEPDIPNVGLVHEGTYAVTVTSGQGCSASQQINVVVYASPNPSITGSTTFCAGGFSILSATSGFQNYLWSNGETSEEIYVNQAGTYSVTVTDIHGCTGSDEVEVIISGELDPEIIGDLVLCGGSQGLLDAGPGYADYIWSTGENSQTIIIQNGGTYSVTVSDGSGCEGSHTVEVTEHPVPQGTAGSNSPVCTGQTINLQASGGTSYQWSGPAGFASSQQNPTIPNAQPQNLGLYQVIVTNVNGCKDTVTTFVNVADGVTLTATAILPDCKGDTLFLFGSGGMDYAWSGPGGYTSQQQNPVIPNAGPPNAGLYVVTDPNAPGCVANDTILVPVPPGPQPNITGNFTICQGEQATLDAGPGFNFYIWSTGQTGQVITTLNPGQFWVVVSDSTGCLGRDSVIVIINNTLDPKLSGKSAVCVGDSSVLSAGSGFSDYFWSTGDTLQSITVYTAGTYHVTVSNSTGCTGSDSISFRVYELPEIDFEVKAEQCADSCDGSIMLIPFEPGYTYKWSNNDSLETIHNLCSGVYLVTVTSPGGCFIVDATFVPAAMELKVTIEEGDSLLVAEANGGSPPYSYLWSNGSTEQSIPRLPGMYAVTVTDDNDCDQVATLLITQLDEVAHRGKGFVLYPNPASNQVQLATVNREPLKEKIHFKILTSGGQLVHGGVMLVGQSQWNFMVENWPAGSYWVHLEFKQGDPGILPLQVAR